jgi:hypothetical protein
MDTRMLARRYNTGLEFGGGGGAGGSVRVLWQRFHFSVQMREAVAPPPTTPRRLF